MITHYYKKTNTDQLAIVEKAKSGVWTHVVKPTEKEREEIIKQFKLESTIVEDIKDVFEVPRFELEDNAAYFFVRYLYDVQGVESDTAPLLIVVGKTFVLTVAEREVPFLNTLIHHRKEFNTAECTRLFFEIISDLIVEYDYHLVKTRKTVHRDMTRVRNMTARDIQRSVLFEQELNETISALVHTQTWLQQLMKGNYLKMSEDESELLEDLLIENGQVLDSAKSILKTIQNIRGASEAILTQNLNNTIRMLTAITIVLTIPTLISSLFGMNVALPFGENGHGFWIILSAILATVLATIYFFIRNKWL